jgi:hypothetical protein
MLCNSKVDFPTFKKNLIDFKKNYPHYVYGSSIWGFELRQTVEVGGFTGGNCWDNTEPTYETICENPTFYLLEDFLSKFYPDKNFSEIEHLVEKESIHEDEYYGNTSDTVEFRINLYDLYKYLES